MAYEEAVRKPEVRHNIILEARRRLLISGVEDVESFDEREIILVTSQGALVIQGGELHIEKLSIEGGELSVEGRIDSLVYEAGPSEKKGGFFSRLFS